MSGTFVHTMGRRLAPDRRGLRSAVAIASVLAAMVLVVLDAAIANVALPTIARSLRVTSAQSVWIITAYQAALVMGLLPWTMPRATCSASRARCARIRSNPSARWNRPPFCPSGKRADLRH